MKFASASATRGYSIVVCRPRTSARLWMDTCCIDERSSAELSKVINSMYLWQANSTIRDVYLHDVFESSFSSARNQVGYPNSNSQPE